MKDVKEMIMDGLWVLGGYGAVSDGVVEALVEAAAAQEASIVSAYKAAERVSSKGRVFTSLARAGNLFFIRVSPTIYGTITEEVERVIEENTTSVQLATIDVVRMPVPKWVNATCECGQADPIGMLVLREEIKELRMEFINTMLEEKYANMH